MNNYTLTKIRKTVQINQNRKWGVDTFFNYFAKFFLDIVYSNERIWNWVLESLLWHI